MKIQQFIFSLFLACSLLVGCGDSTEKKEGDQNTTTEMKQSENDNAATTDKTPETPDAQSDESGEVSGEAIAKVMKELLSSVATDAGSVSDIIDADASWIDKIGKLSSDAGVAKKLAELGDSPEEIMKKIKEMAAAVK